MNKSEYLSKLNTISFSPAQEFIAKYGKDYVRNHDINLYFLMGAHAKDFVSKYGNCLVWQVEDPLSRWIERACV